MKKILPLLLILLLGMQVCLAQEEEEQDINSFFSDETSEAPAQIQGYLEYNKQQEAQEAQQEAVYLEPVKVNKINFTKPQKVGVKSLISGAKKPTFHPMQDKLESASMFSTQEYTIRPVSTSYIRKLGKFSFGTSYDSSLDNARENYSTGVFAKYEGKHFALRSGFSKSTNDNYNYYSDTLSVAPELKLTKNLSFLDIMRTDVSQINQSNEFVLRYTPHFKKYADEVQFELGAGQNYYQNNYINSSVRFSTRFKL